MKKILFMILLLCTTIVNSWADNGIWHDKIAGESNGKTYDIEYVITHNDDKTLSVELLSMNGSLADMNPGKQCNIKGDWYTMVNNKVQTTRTFDAGVDSNLFFYFPYPGGAVRIDVQYTIGASKVPDVIAPNDLTVNVAAVSDVYVTLAMKATDEASDKIVYTIKNGTQTYTVTGNNNETTRYNIEGLTPDTEYTFSITAADKAGNSTADAVSVQAKTRTSRGSGVAQPALSGNLYTVNCELINLDGVVTISNIVITKNNPNAKDVQANINIDNGYVIMPKQADGTYKYTISKNTYLPGDKVTGFYYLVYEGGADRIDFSYIVPKNAGWDSTAPKIVSVTAKENASTPSSVTLEAKANDENGTQVKFLVYQDNIHIATIVGNSGETVTARVGGLMDDTNYNFKVIAIDVVGNESSPVYVTAKTSSYKLVWADEFDSNTLNKNWNVEVNGDGGGNWEQQYYTNRTENLNITNGNLVITAIREPYQGMNYTSGRVNSKNKVTFEHGKIEARIKLPKTKKGLWPAFWMMGNDIDNVGWPKCGEIDILEAGHQNGFGGNEETYFSGCIHWGEAWDQHGYWDGSVYNPYSIMDGEYHVFTCIWEEEWLKCYVDGQKEPYFNAAISKNIDPNIVSADYMHKPNFIIMNLAVGGQFPGLYDVDDITALPEPGASASMYVDYVRVYQGVNNLTLNSTAENDKAKVTDTTPPSNLNITVSTVAPVITVSATDDSNDIISYTVLNGTKALSFGAAQSGQSTTIDLKGLPVGRSYVLTVVATDVFGNSTEKDIFESIPGSVNPNTPAPDTKMTAKDVYSIYSDKYGAPAQKNYNADWWMKPDCDESAIASDNYLLYTGQMSGVIGWEFSAINAATANYMHIDIWPSASGVINIEPINTDANYSAAISLSVTGGKWNAFDIPVAEMAAENKNFTPAGINQLKISGYGLQSEFCIDNVYFFYSDSTTGISVNAADNDNRKIFSINGMQFNNDARLSKGIYIINGKKVVR